MPNNNYFKTSDKASGIAVVAGFSLVIMTHLVRPLPISTPQTIKICIGSLPSFGAGVGLPFVIKELVIIIQNIIWHQQKIMSFIGICIVSLGLLVGWEYMSFVLWAIPNDLNDFLASFLGVTFALIINRLVSERRKNHISKI